MKTKITALALSGLLALSACTTPYSDDEVAGALVGAGLGTITAKVLGADPAWTVVGALTGAAAGRPGRGDLDVAAAGELVEVVPGHVGVQIELLGHRRCGDAVGLVAEPEEDVPAGRVAERRRDRGDGRREVGRTQGRRGG